MNIQTLFFKQDAMVYLNSWQKNLSRKNSLTLISLFIFLFIFYEFILFSRLLGQRYFDLAMNSLGRAHSLGKEIIVEKSLSYQKTLKLLTNALRLNPYDVRPSFEYAEIISQIGDDAELSNSIDIKSLGIEQEGRTGFYELAKVKYAEAVLKEPTNAIYHQRLGSIYDKLQDAKNTEGELKKALLLDSQNVSIHLYLSQYFLSKDRQTDFLYHLYRAVELYKKALRGGGLLAKMVVDFLKAIGREDLIEK